MLRLVREGCDFDNFSPHPKMWSPARRSVLVQVHAPKEFFVAIQSAYGSIDTPPSGNSADGAPTGAGGERPAAAAQRSGGAMPPGATITGSPASSFSSKSATPPGAVGLERGDSGDSGGGASPSARHHLEVPRSRGRSVLR